MHQSRRSIRTFFSFTENFKGAQHSPYTLLGKTGMHVSLFLCQVHGLNFAKVGAKIVGNLKLGKKYRKGA